MIYTTLGVMSGSSLDGVDMLAAEFRENAGHWEYEMLFGECAPYTEGWVSRLQEARQLNAYEYLLLHSDYGHYLGQLVSEFIRRNGLEFRIQLIASHGHTIYHAPSRGMTAQLGDGASIAAMTGINVVSDLRAMDLALGGQGAPIVPIGEKFLFSEYDYFLNLGGIANVSVNHPEQYLAFDVCPANRVLNMLIRQTGKAFDEGGRLAATGQVQDELLGTLNDLEYYRLPPPKSLSNDFGTDVLFPLVRDSRFSLADQLATYVEHIAIQVARSIRECPMKPYREPSRMMITGGGAHHLLLCQRLEVQLQTMGIQILIPDSDLVDYKEALIMGLIGVLRWREEINVLASVTGARRNSIGGAVWIGQEG